MSRHSWSRYTREAKKDLGVLSDIQQRVCLSCLKKFTSYQIDNRICQDCKEYHRAVECIEPEYYGVTLTRIANSHSYRELNKV